MTVTKDTLKGYFNTGDKPTESQFSELIDSCYNESVYLLDCVSTSPESPYLAGSNNESEIICFSSDINISRKAFIELPNIYTNEDANEHEVESNRIAQTYTNDTKIGIDASYYGCDEAIIGASRWTNTNLGIQDDLRNIRNTYPTISQYMLYATRIGANAHLEVEFYPDDGLPLPLTPPYTTGRWNMSGGLGLLLNRSDNDTDGYGNNAEVDSNGFVTRWCLSEEEYFHVHFAPYKEYWTSADFDGQSYDYTWNAPVHLDRMLIDVNSKRNYNPRKKHLRVDISADTPNGDTMYYELPYASTLPVETKFTIYRNNYSWGEIRVIIQENDLDHGGNYDLLRDDLGKKYFCLRENSSIGVTFESTETNGWEIFGINYAGFEKRGWGNPPEFDDTEYKRYTVTKAQYETLQSGLTGTYTLLSGDDLTLTNGIITGISVHVP